MKKPHYDALSPSQLTNVVQYPNQKQIWHTQNCDQGPSPLHLRPKRTFCIGQIHHQHHDFMPI